MGRLDGKIALVTGAAKGIGAASARLLAGEGAAVIVADVDVAAGEAVAASTGGRFVRLDVRDEGEWEALAADIAARDGRLDILVNNAGVVEIGNPETISAKDYRVIMSVSVDGTVWGIKHSLPLMKARGGSIINMSSIASVCGEPYVAAYSAAKGAVEAYSRAVAVYCAQNKIPVRSNSIHPAGIDTPMVQALGSKLQSAGSAPLAEAGNAAGLNRLGQPEDVGWLVVFLASDESRFISGQRFLVDNSASVTQGAVPS